MAWKPKTIAGKILKGAVIGGGSILGLATGIGGVGGVIKGVGALKGASQGIGGLTRVFDKVGTAAVNLVTGTNKDERKLIAEVKDKTREAINKMSLVDKLVKAGASVSEAKSKVGISDVELTEYDGKAVQSASIGDIFKSPIGLIAVGVTALFLLPKILKSR